MEAKTFPIAEVKAQGTKGEFEALVSAFGNIDWYGDRVVKGAFKRAIDEQEPPPVIYGHEYSSPPIGETLEWGESRKGLVVKGRLFVEEEDFNPLAKAVYSAMKSREGRAPALRKFSFAYEASEVGFVEEEGNKVRELKEIFPVYEVGPCAIPANTNADLITAPKQMTMWMPTGTTSTNGVWTFTSREAWAEDEEPVEEKGETDSETPADIVLPLDLLMPVGPISEAS